jgi:tyrosyl-tRNA synthetase
MTLSEDLAWRGLIKDKTFGDTKWLDKPQKFYLGIDASSDSLTIGNLAVIMLARRLLDSGWGTVLLAGGATSLVGDPGGKQDERELKSTEEIAKNIEAIKTQFEKLFAGKPHELVNNLDWLGDIKYLDLSARTTL